LLFPLYIAKRYLFARKSHNVINIITLVSVIGVMVGAMALVVVLSVFNGFEKLILSLFNAFNPDLEISLVEGKTFSLEDFPVEELQKVPGVVHYSEVLDETALITYFDRQHLITMRGVSESFREVTGIDTLLVEGEFVLERGDSDYLILGQGVSYFLDANINDMLNPLTMYIPKKGSTLSLQPMQAFNATSNFASGVFGIQSEFDLEYVLVPIRLARKLLDSDDEVSSIALKIDSHYSSKKVQSDIEQLIGPAYVVKNRYQQQEFLYKIMRSEKWAIFLILAFILVIAAFNVIGSLTMLVLEKRKDIHILHSLGASKKVIRQVFLLEGIMISLGGAIAGITLGAVICWLQIRFNLISIQAEGSFIIDAYPVEMKGIDFVLVVCTVFFIGLLASALPVKNIHLLLNRNA
jgi:lipoprotein-releasing system permease protein